MVISAEQVPTRKHKLEGGVHIAQGRDTFHQLFVITICSGAGP